MLVPPRRGVPATNPQSAGPEGARLLSVGFQPYVNGQKTNASCRDAIAGTLSRSFNVFSIALLQGAFFFSTVFVGIGGEGIPAFVPCGGRFSAGAFSQCGVPASYGEDVDVFAPKRAPARSRVRPERVSRKKRRSRAGTPFFFVRVKARITSRPSRRRISPRLRRRRPSARR